MPLHPNYKCQCEIATPRIVDGEDSGLCAGCDRIYDERLYEARLRQHVQGLREGAELDEILQTVNPELYAQITSG